MSVVHVAVPFVVFVSALMVLPPVAVVMVTDAKALLVPAKNNPNAKIAKAVAPRVRKENICFIELKTPAEKRVRKQSF